MIEDPAGPGPVRRPPRAAGARRCCGRFNEAGVLAAADVHVALRLAALGGDDDPEVLLAAALAVRGPAARPRLRRPRDRARHRRGRGRRAGRPRRAAVAGRRRLDGAAGGEPARRGGRGRRRGGPPAPARRLPPLPRPLLARGAAPRRRPARARARPRRPACARTCSRTGSRACSPGRTTAASAARRRPPSAAASRWSPAGPARARRRPSRGSSRCWPSRPRRPAPPRRTSRSPRRPARPPPGSRRRCTPRRASSTSAEAVRAQLLALGGVTLHRLLGRQPRTHSRFRHHRGNRLPHDVVVVDETSMVSLSLMARLVEAVRPEARLILVGDPGQLTSIEAGAVLATSSGRPPTAAMRAPAAPARAATGGEVPGGRAAARSATASSCSTACTASARGSPRSPPPSAAATPTRRSPSSPTRRRA